MKRRMPFLVLFVSMLGFFATVVACDGEREGHPAASPRYAPGVGWQFPSESYGSCDGPRVAEYGDAHRVEQEDREADVIATNATKAGQSLRFEPQRPTYVTVTGPGDDVAAFVTRYYDALHPEWRKHKTVSQIVEDNLRTCRRTGKAAISLATDAHREAYITASVALPIPGIDDAD